MPTNNTTVRPSPGSVLRFAVVTSVTRRLLDTTTRRFQYVCHSFADVCQSVTVASQGFSGVT